MKLFIGSISGICCEWTIRQHLRFPITSPMTTCYAHRNLLYIASNEHPVIEVYETPSYDRLRIFTTRVMVATIQVADEWLFCAGSERIMVFRGDLQLRVMRTDSRVIQLLLCEGNRRLISVERDSVTIWDADLLKTPCACELRCCTMQTCSVYRSARLIVLESGRGCAEVVAVLGGVLFTSGFMQPITLWDMASGTRLLVADVYITKMIAARDVIIAYALNRVYTISAFGQVLNVVYVESNIMDILSANERVFVTMCNRYAAEIDAYNGAIINRVCIHCTETIITAFCN